jgi:16S rRNA G966 N2-methylase RsmD
MIQNFLNKRHSTRALSDEEFNSILPQLAVELSAVDFVPRFTEEELRKDWDRLRLWSANGTHISSTSRAGMKLCEHFFPNFWDIEDSKGNSFRKLWADPQLLEKVLRWNRKSHSTPYLSELRRGVYFCGGLCKSTMYRPQIARLVTKGCGRVLDPCMGWGGRLLGSVASGAEYVGFDPNTETFRHLNEMVEFLGIQHKVRLICDDALNMDSYDLGKFDVVLTSPPYFDLEVYSHETTQSVASRTTYEAWNNGFLAPLIQKSVAHLNENGKSCWNVAKVKNHDMWESVETAHADLGFAAIKEYGVSSSARQVNQSASKNKKTVDRTVVYSRKD